MFGTCPQSLFSPRLEWLVSSELSDRVNVVCKIALFEYVSYQLLTEADDSSIITQFAVYTCRDARRLYIRRHSPTPPPLVSTTCFTLVRSTNSSSAWGRWSSPVYEGPYHAAPTELEIDLRCSGDYWSSI